jgi:hypothetical protein
MVVSLPETRRWFRKQSIAAAMDKKVAFVFTSIFLGQAYFLFLHDYKGPENNHPGIILVQAFWYIFPIFHSFKQLQGITKLFEKPKPSAKWYFSEQNIFHILTGLIFVHGIIFMAFLHGQISHQFFSLIRASLVGLFILGSIPLFRSKNKARNLYLIRIILFPLSFISFMGWVGSGILHGVEYFMISRRMLGHSEAKANFSLLFKNTFSVLILIYGISAFLLNGHYGILAFFTGGKDINAAWYHFFHLSSLSIAFCHHYFDGVLFRMKDPITRAHIGPLLGGARALEMKPQQSDSISGMNATENQKAV